MSLSFKAFVKHKDTSEVVKAFLAAEGLAETELIKGTIADAAKALNNEPSPDFLLVELSSKETAKAFAELDELANNVAPTTKVIVCGTVDELSFYKELISMGVYEYLLNPLKPEQLEKAIRKNHGNGNAGCNSKST
jgi:pilus assembly protein CpaE